MAAVPEGGLAHLATTFTAACPECGADAEWTAAPLGTMVPVYSIACPCL